MRKFTNLLLTAALLFGAVGGVNATKLYADLSAASAVGGNAEGWEESLSGGYVFTWKGSWDARVVITDIAGSISEYDKLIITCPEFTDAWRVDVEFSYGGTKTIGGAYYSVSDKTIVLSDVLTDSERKSIANVRINTASGSGSIRITNIYLEKPMSLVWADDGTAEINLSDLTASGSFTLNDQTGELTGTGESGSLRVNFPAGGVDLSNLTGFSITYTGDNLFGNFEIGDGTTNKGFWSNVTGRDDLNQYMTVGNVGAPTAITNWKWNNNSTAGTMTISSIKLKAKVVTASNPHETLLTTLTYVNGNCSNEFGTSQDQGATIYGKGWSIDGANYADLSGFDEMRIYGTPNKGVRLLFNFDQEAPIKVDVTFNLNSEGYYSYDLSALSAHKLNAIKFPYDGKTGVITKVILYKESIPVDFSYAFAGAGALSSSATAALADATATSIDATDITAATELISANPNCLITANAGMITNENNVIVDDVCANLVLTDNYPFQAPSNFTATAASYSTTINTTAQCGTLCLPFAATIPGGVTAYTLSYVNGSDAATLTPVETTIPANTPVLLNGSGAATFTGSGAVVADATNVSGALTGVFANTVVPLNSYVLQNGASGIGFYKVASDITAKPFRAYLTGQVAGSKDFLSFNFDDATAISQVQGSGFKVQDSEIFNLAGQRMSKLQKGVNIVNGKKVLVK